VVDRKARDAFAELLHQFIAGRIENFDFENRVPGSKDPAIDEIWWRGCWPLYDDFRSHHLAGKWRIPNHSRPEIAKWILFLHSDYEYEWRPQTGVGSPLGLILRWLTFGRFPGFPYTFRDGDPQAWPFISMSQLDEARRNPRYLRGVVTPNPRLNPTRSGGLRPPTQTG
jgi:hypothetical protein